MRTKMLSAVLFDLDGTLFDTAADLAEALNAVIKNHQRSPLDYDAIRPVVSEGSLGLLKLGFGISPDDPNFSSLRAEFFSTYDLLAVNQTKLFAGMLKLLTQIEQLNLCWGIITNKPRHFSLKLLEHFNLTDRCSVLVCADELKKPKPDPEGLLLACHKLKILNANCIYIGDQEIDVIAAKAAGMKSVIFLSGYQRPQTNPQDWQADYYANNSEEIFNIIQTMTVL